MQRHHAPGEGQPSSGVPRTIYAYGGLALAVVLVSSVRDIPAGHVFGSIFDLCVIASVFYFVWKGSRIAWSLATASPAVRVAMSIYRPQHWWLIVVEVFIVLLLISPPSVRYVWGTKMPSDEEALSPSVAGRSCE